MLKFIDLFAGVGGFHLGMRKFAQCVFASECDTQARKTYEANWGHELIANNAEFAGDITKLDCTTIPDFDILCAGFPCQPFSVAGHQRGFDDETRGTLFFNVMEIIRAKQPRVIFLENVKNLVSHGNGRTLQIILGSIKDAGYRTHWKVLNSKTHSNIAHNRARVFMVAFKNDEDFSRFKFPDEVELTTTVIDFLDRSVDQRFYQTNTESPSVVKMLEGIKEKNVIYQYRRYYMRRSDGVSCPTLTANMGTGGHNVPLLMDDNGVRKLTPRECFNLQGYPRDFILPHISSSSLYKQAGNTVTASLVERIAKNIAKAIEH